MWGERLCTIELSVLNFCLMHPKRNVKVDRYRHKYYKATNLCFGVHAHLNYKCV